MRKRNYIADEIDALNKNISTIEKLINNPSTSVFGKNVGAEMLELLEEVKCTFEDPEADILLIENMYNNLPSLYIQIPNIQ